MYVTILYNWFVRGLVGAVCCKLSLRSCDRHGSRQFKLALPLLTKTLVTTITLRFEQDHKEAKYKLSAHVDRVEIIIFRCSLCIAPGPDRLALHQQHRFCQ